MITKTNGSDYLIMKILKDQSIPLWSDATNPFKVLSLKKDYFYQFPNSIARLIMISNRDYYYFLFDEKSLIKNKDDNKK